MYLSSTRVYGPLGTTGAMLGADPREPDHLYNISKMMGEAACLTVRPEQTRIVRLSNVYGADIDAATFLGSVIRAAVLHGRVGLGTSMETERDYVGIDDVVRMIAAIAERGQQRIYDIGFGANRTTAQLAEVLQRQTGCTVEVAAGAPTVLFPRIDVSALRTEFGYTPRDILDALPELVASVKQRGSMQSC